MKHITRDMFPVITDEILNTADMQAHSTGKDCCNVTCARCCLSVRHNNLGFAICSTNGRDEFSNDDEGLTPFVRRIAKEFLDLASEPKTTKIDLTE